MPWRALLWYETWRPLAACDEHKLLGDEYELSLSFVDPSRAGGFQPMFFHGLFN
jgi:hypothetical protein